MVQKVAILGSGLVGKSWAMIFASKGYHVMLHDVSQIEVNRALKDIFQKYKEFEKEDVLRGELSINEQMSLISGAKDLFDCLENAFYIQECIPENLEMKQQLWSQIDDIISSDSIICASSSSAILPSKISEHLKKRKAQFLVVHPINPPYLVKMVELVPSSSTNELTQNEAYKLMKNIGQIPVLLKRELPGFALNRLQYTLLNECWRLISNGVLSLEDVDLVIKEGLGPRYAFVGPMETIHLNANGLKDYISKYGAAIYKISSDLGDIPKAWTYKSEFHEEIDEINEQMLSYIPLSQLESRRILRDTKLASLSNLKNTMEL